MNIRARAKELAALLSDVDMIRMERRKARANRAKYQGAGSADFVPGSGGGRYGGFSSDAYYASGGASGAYGSAASAASAQPDFDEYDAGDDETHTAPSSVTRPASAQTAASTQGSAQPAVADLFSFDDEPAPTPKTAALTSENDGLGSAAGSSSLADADDFDDFQSALPSQPSYASTKSPAGSTGSSTPAGPKNNGAFFDLLDNAPLTSSSTKPVMPSAPAPSWSQTQARSPAPAPAPLSIPPPVSSLQANPKPAVMKPTSTPTQKAPASSASLFDDLWAESRGSAGVTSKVGNNKSMAQLAKDQTSQSVWGSAPSGRGAPASTSTSTSTSSGASKDLFDLL